MAAGGPAPRPSDLSPSVFVAIIRVSCAGKIDFAMYRTDFFLCLFAVSMMLYRRLPKHRRPSSELPEVTHRVYLDIRECCLSPFACVLFVCLIVVGPPLTRHIVPLSHPARAAYTTYCSRKNEIRRVACADNLRAGHPIDHRNITPPYITNKHSNSGRGRADTRSHRAGSVREHRAEDRGEFPFAMRLRWGGRQSQRQTPVLRGDEIPSHR